MPARKKTIARCWSLAATACLYAGVASAQAPADNGAIYLHDAGDRAERLIEGARREGTLVLYTSLATTESIPLTQAFEKKYGVKVQLWRTLSENIVQRAVAEARGRRDSADVIETNSPQLEALGYERLIAPFASPYIASLHGWAVPQHRQWVGDRVDLFGVAFNTGKVRREEIPASYEGFLDPKWVGRIAVEASDDEWMAAIVKHWGEARGGEFFRRLAAMKPEVRKGHILLAQLIAAGEIPVGLTVYGGNAESIRRKGGPIDWVAAAPLVGRLQGVALARNAPHPHAALLFADFLLSPEGMQLLDSFGRVPTARGFHTVMDDTPYVLVDPAAADAETARWRRTWKELFIR